MLDFYGLMKSGSRFKEEIFQGTLIFFIFLRIMEIYSL